MKENATDHGTARLVRLVRLSESNLTILDPQADVRGRKVFDRDGEEIGRVDDLLVDEGEARVRFLRVAAGGFLGIGERHLLVPVDAVTGVDDDRVRVGHPREHVAGAPAYDPTLADDQRTPQYWAGMYGYYGLTPYWGAGYAYPPYPYY